MESDRLPPQSAAAERALLGCLMRYSYRLEEVRDELLIEHFYFDAHQKIYGAIIRLHDRRRPTDALHVINELRDLKQLGDVGGDSVVMEINGEAAIASHQYIQTIQEFALRRALIHAAVEIDREAQDGNAPAEELLDLAQGRLGQLAIGSARSESSPIIEVVNRALEAIDARAAGKQVPGVPTGFVDLDETLCGGLLRGGMTILAARPSVGKTTLGMHIARNACESGSSVLFISLEQPEQELSERFLSSVSGVAGKKIRMGKLRDDDPAKLSAAADSIRRWKLQVNDKPAQTARQIAAGARRSKRKAGGLDLIVVDYLGLVEPENRKANRNEQTGASARRLRDMAREMSVPVLVCCQLNRDAAHGDKQAPKLHHLRDSGEIEQLADAVLILHRKAFGSEGVDDIEVHVAKQRNGPLAVIDFGLQASIYSFFERGIDP